MKIVLVGAGGYGESYYNIMNEYLHNLDSLCAIVDPYVKNVSYYQQLIERKIPLFDTLDAFYASGGKADLVIVSSPINFHESQSITALQNGSHVLCEKPLCPTLQQAERMQVAAQQAGRYLGVGFQWSYTPAILDLKRDIMSGMFGKPVLLKTTVQWPRDNEYYTSGAWKGRARDKDGHWVLDSVAANATAHYMHNMFFVLGASLETSCMPEYIEGSLYRARDIETYDTCFVRGGFADGSRFYFSASHVCEDVGKPTFVYEFEDAVIYKDEQHESITAVWRDGRKKDYTYTDSMANVAKKVERMMEAVSGGAAPTCGVDTIMPHLTVCNAMLDNMPIKDFAEESRLYYTNPERVAVKGLSDAMRAGFEKAELPDEMGYAWAADKVHIDIASVKSFEGRLF